MLAARSLPSPRTHWRKHRRLRRRASGRSFAYNLRFPGQYYQAETGLNQNMARNYDPELNRYLESDPLALKAGVNTYSYVGADPIARIDPLGLDFLGKTLARQYLCQFGREAWDKIRQNRDSTKPLVPGTDAEAMRNAEHYLWAYTSVVNNSYEWGPTVTETVGYNALKF